MKYIYDVTLNFNEQFYDFFEWNNSDYIYHIKKIPIVEINKNDFINIFNNYVKLDNETYNMIKNKTEIYGNKELKLTCILIKNENYLFALKFDDNRKSKEISSILVEEEFDILEVKTKVNNDIKYKIISARSVMKNTRNEEKNLKLLSEQINNLNLNQDKEKIKYLYFEHFGNINENENDALKKLKAELKNKHSLDNLTKIFMFESNKN